MSNAFIQTERLTLLVESTESVLARIASLPPEYQAEVSQDWLKRLRVSPPSPWTHGFSIRLSATNEVVGQCGYKGAPDQDGVVEIAYALEPAFEGRGYAREAALAITRYAIGSGGAQIVRAHTRSDNPKSQRVLQACGFVSLGEVIDPEDGPVLRWEFTGDL